MGGAGGSSGGDGAGEERLKFSIAASQTEKAPRSLGAFRIFWNSPQCRIWDRKSLVRSCCGFLKNSSGVFISTICP